MVFFEFVMVGRGVEAFYLIFPADMRKGKKPSSGSKRSERKTRTQRENEGKELNGLDHRLLCLVSSTLAQALPGKESVTQWEEQQRSLVGNGSS